MPGPKTSTGFTSLSQYLAANQGGVNNMTNAVVGGATSAADKAHQEANNVSNEAFDQGAAHGDSFDPSTLADYTSALHDAQTAQAGLSALGSATGIGDALQQQYGKSGGYTLGDKNFDANLMAVGSRGAISDAQNKYSDLSGYLNSHANDAVHQGAHQQGPATMDNGDPGQVYPAPTPVKAKPTPMDPNPDNPGSAKNNPTPRLPGDFSGFSPDPEANKPPKYTPGYIWGGGPTGFGGIGTKPAPGGL